MRRRKRNGFFFYRRGGRSFGEVEVSGGSKSRGGRSLGRGGSVGEVETTLIASVPLGFHTMYIMNYCISGINNVMFHLIYIIITT